MADNANSRTGGNMPTRNIVLTQHQSHFVEHLVASGKYQNASEVLRAGLRLLEQRAKEDSMRLEVLRQAIHVGIDDIESGRFSEFRNQKSLRDHIVGLTDQPSQDA